VFEEPDPEVSVRSSALSIGPAWLLQLGPLLFVACGPPDTRLLTVESDHTGETYALEVLSPEGTAAGDALPTVWLLDGHYHFDDLAQHVDRQWRRGDLADFRLVGVRYKDLVIQDLSALSVIEDKRTVDLTFPDERRRSTGHIPAQDPIYSRHSPYI
jgi:predicted alpha/beta superfamily hydrolase